MRLAIVDDESAYRRHIVEMIDSVYGKSEVSCYLYSDGSELIRSFENGFKLDAVFLDIEMKDVDGMTAAKKIREYSKDIPVIFLTSHTELAMDGYEVDDSCSLEGGTRTLQRLLRMNDGLASGLQGGLSPSTGPFGGLAASL